ncbi:MAG: cupin domain-containing protein [Gammaproteobacteria bacterium]
MPAGNLSKTLRFFIDVMGFRLDSITPADDPAFARLSGHGLRLRLDVAYRGDPGTLLLCTGGNRQREAMTAPNGTRIEFGTATQSSVIPELQPGLSLQRFDDREDDWKSGRAGMQYRDLIPDRLGGYLIASHIRIPKGGPVADNVHYHDIRFQLIYCYRGWVRLVYEDQGEPFVMRPGDCVLQPSHIRHRVLESSDGLEVIEIASPAAHMTYLDHDMRLPTGRHLPKRDYSGQSFVFYCADEAPWEDKRESGFAVRDLGIAEATKGLAAAKVIRPTATCEFAGEPATRSKAFAFTFVLRGQLILLTDGRSETSLTAGDIFVIPAGLRRGFKTCSEDLELLEVTLPA